MSIYNDITSLSKKEVEIIAELESKKMYYFSRRDIKHHFDSESKLRYALHRLISKKRIFNLNKNKYFLVPIKARYGRWTDDSFRIADEIFNGKDYYIGGWSAANYWRLTDQIPFKIEVFTNKRNGTFDVLSTKFIFKKTTQKRIDHAVIRKIGEHSFRILGKKETKKWMNSRD